MTLLFISLTIITAAACMWQMYLRSPEYTMHKAIRRKHESSPKAGK